jgi:hypothetical protein
VSAKSVTMVLIRFHGRRAVRLYHC